MINFGTQYYRPPFPEAKYWEDDMRKIKDSGLNCIQLWLLWSWIESNPGKFNFDDYDKLADLAAKHGLNLILSTIAEVQPYWIEREVPDCALVTKDGQRVISSNRGEIHFGITPGGCFDHPEVFKRMMNFIRKTVDHFKDRENISGWDCWNEIRWNVNANAFVCYCQHTLTAYRKWLEAKYGSLDALNKAWIRRYGSMYEVSLGRILSHPYTEMMSFEHFLTERTNEHAAERYRLIKSIDPNRPVTIHGCQPSISFVGSPNLNQALNKGNDWFLADKLDGIGCSNFPQWWGASLADYITNMAAISSAARGKLFWVSELQGGRANFGFQPHLPVPPEKQQKWVWEAIAHGASTIIFWCWRNEVFGLESGGFGIIGDDGFKEQRLIGMKITGNAIEKYGDILKDYRPDGTDVGIFFSPQSYYLYWAQEGSAERIFRSIRGYFKALTVKNIPCKFIEEKHLEELSGLKILFMPRVNVVDDETTEKLLTFVRNGGMLFCECETGAWDSRGIYRYPEDRFTALYDGVREIGRRSIQKKRFKANLAGEKYHLKPTHWLSPWLIGQNCRVIAKFAEPNTALILEHKLGKGKIILCGAYLGEEYDKERYEDFENFIFNLLETSNVRESIIVDDSETENFDDFVHVKCGMSRGKRLIFVFVPDEKKYPVNIKFNREFSGVAELTDILTEQKIPLKKEKDGFCSIKFKKSEANLGIHVLLES